MHHRRFAVAVLFCLFLVSCARSPITEPRLSDLEPSVLELTAHVGGTAVGVFSFTNVGTGRLAYSVEAVDARLSVVSATAGALEPAHQARVVVAAVCEVEGVFAGSVEVLSADAAAGARTLTVNVDCGRAPTEPVNAPPMASFTFTPPRVLSRIERFGNDFGETTVLDGLPHDADHRVFPDLEGRVFRYLGSASRGPEVAVRVQYFVSSWQCIDPDQCLGVSARNADPATSFMAFDHDNVPYVAWSEQGEVLVAYLPE